MKRIEHLGIAVESLEKSIPMFEALLNTSCYKKEGVASEGVQTAFFQVGESKIELLEATIPDSPIAKFREKRARISSCRVRSSRYRSRTGTFRGRWLPIDPSDPKRRRRQQAHRFFTSEIDQRFTC